jgi:electron transport complex protein RnfE
MSRRSEISAGIVRENPLFSLLLGLCPAIAVSTRVFDALVLSLGVFCVLIATALLTQPFRILLPAPQSPPRARAFISLVLVAALVGALDLLLSAWLPETRGRLGIYLPVIAVNCLILGRTAVFSWNARTAKALADAAGLGIGFAAGILLIAVLREAIGSGAISLPPFGAFSGRIELGGLKDTSVRILALPAGGLLLLGYLIAAKRMLTEGRKGEKQ